MATSRKNKRSAQKRNKPAVAEDVVDAQVVSETAVPDASVDELASGDVAADALNTPEMEGSDAATSATVTDAGEGSSDTQMQDAPSDHVSADTADEEGAQTSADAVPEEARPEDTAAHDAGAEEPHGQEPEAGDAGAPQEPGDPPAPVAPPEPTRQGGLFGFVLGGGLAALLGFGLAHYVVPDGWPNPSARAIELQNALNSQTQALEAQSATIASLESTIAAQKAEMDALQSGDAQKLTELENADAAVQEQIASILEQIKTLPRTSGNTVLPADLANLLEEQKAEISALQGDLREMASFAEGQIEQAQNEAESAARAEARALARDALNRVRLALASGAPYAAELDAIGGAVEIPEALGASAAEGVKPLTDIQADFPPLAREALSASLREVAGSAPADRVRLFIQDQLSARSLTARDGDDPDAVLSRAEAAVQAGNLSEALATLDSLPDSGKAKLEAWSATAQARDGALAAFSTVTEALSAD